ncbi:MAG TPA: hypothetical protein VM684_20455, partial [Gaiellales bacterium]|nr:hypothetical protein [Gaiellales bacterium]
RSRGADRRWAGTRLKLASRACDAVYRRAPAAPVRPSRRLRSIDSLAFLTIEADAPAKGVGMPFTSFIEGFQGEARNG